MTSESPQEILKGAQSLGFQATLVGADELRIQLGSATLVVSKVTDRAGRVIGFESTPWHFRGDLMLMTGEATHIKAGPNEILKGLKRGTILVFERHLRGKLKDRWLAHKDEPFSTFDLGPAEELRIWRAPIEQKRDFDSTDSNV